MCSILKHCIYQNIGKNQLHEPLSQIKGSQWKQKKQSCPDSPVSSNFLQLFLGDINSIPPWGHPYQVYKSTQLASLDEEEQKVSSELLLVFQTSHSGSKSFLLLQPDSFPHVWCPPPGPWVARHNRHKQSFNPSYIQPFPQWRSWTGSIQIICLLPPVGFKKSSFEGGNPNYVGLSLSPVIPSRTQLLVWVCMVCLSSLPSDLNHHQMVTS